jgi:hypothetical protein
MERIYLPKMVTANKDFTSARSCLFLSSKLDELSSGFIVAPSIHYILLYIYNLLQLNQRRRQFVNVSHEKAVRVKILSGRYIWIVFSSPPPSPKTPKLPSDTVESGGSEFT